MKTSIFFCAFIFTHCTQVKACPTFGLPQLSKTLAQINCASLLKIDSDGDGIPDWINIIDSKFSDILIPLDEDMDDDGIINIMDPEPVHKDINNKETNKLEHSLNLPAHLIYFSESNIGISEEVKNLQLQLYKRFAVVAVHFPGIHKATQLKALIDILNKGLISKNIKTINKLKYVYAALPNQNSLGGKAYFSPDLKAIIIKDAFLGIYQDTLPELYQVLAHEVGHALAFSTLTPGELYDLGKSLGPWKRTSNSNTPVIDFFDERLLAKHPDYDAPAWYLSKKLLVPSRYALSNIHEWFAETFAANLINKLNKKEEILINH